MRVDPQLLALFQEACHARNWTASATIRDFMANEVQAYQTHLAKKEAAKRASEASGQVSGASVSSDAEKSPVAVSGKPEGPVARRMRLKKEAKLRTMADEDFDDE